MDLEQRITCLEGIIANMMKSGEYSFNKNVKFERNILIKDGVNIQTQGTTGTKIGTSASQKIGFFGQTPKVQVPTASIPSTAAGIVITLKEFGFYET